MKLTEDLQYLAKLHQEGSLTDSEFALAKQKLLSEKSTPDYSSRSNDDLGRAARTYVNWQIASSIIGGIIFLYVFVNYFVPQLPGNNQPTFKVVSVAPTK